MKIRYYFLLIPATLSLCAALFTACSSKGPTGPQNIFPTSTPTPYGGPTYSLSGPLTYNGTGTVGSPNPVYVFLTTNPLFQGSNYAAATLTTATGTYNFTNLAPGTYYLGTVFSAVGSWGPFSNNPPPAGDPYYVYGGGSSGCTLNATVGVTVTGNTTGPALTFGNGCTFASTNSLTGAVTYSGGGTVSSGTPLYVFLFTNPDILEGSPVAAATFNGPATTAAYSFTNLPTGNYYLVALYSSGVVATHYVPINGYYDVYGGGSNGCSLVSNTPVFVNGATTGPSLTFGNTCAYSAAGTLTGAVTYNGSGTVSAANKLWVLAFNTSQLEGSSPVTYASFTTNNPTYNFANISSGPYYLLALYDSSGTWAGPGGSGGPPSGDSYFIYGGGNGGCDLNPTAVIVNGPTTATAMVFGDSCKYSTAVTLSGSVSYTGGNTVNSTDSIYALLFNSPNIGPNNGASIVEGVTLTSASGSYSFAVTSGTYYLAAIFDAQGGWVPGSGQPPNGDYYYAYGAANNGCDLRTSLSPVYVTGNTTGPNLAFGNSCQIEEYSVSGSVTLSSSTSGTPSSGSPFYVFAFTDPSNPFGSVWSGAVTAFTSMTSGGGGYYTTYTLKNLPPNQYYLGAFFDSAGGVNYSGGNSLSVPSGEYVIYYDAAGDDGTCSSSSFAAVTVTTSNVSVPYPLWVGTSCTTP